MTQNKILKSCENTLPFYELNNVSSDIFYKIKLIKEFVELFQ